MPTQNLINAGFAGAAVTAAAVAGSLASQPDSEWYQSLDKPSWQPPAVIFPIVWSALYANIAVTSTAVLNEFDRRDEPEAAAAYRKSLATNLALNAGWSWLFFRAHNLTAATVGAGVLAASSIQLANQAATARPRFGKLLGVYAAWTCFATVLTCTVCWRDWRGSKTQSAPGR
jgi:translocator protein